MQWVHERGILRCSLLQWRKSCPDCSLHLWQCSNITLGDTLHGMNLSLAAQPQVVPFKVCARKTCVAHCTADCTSYHSMSSVIKHSLLQHQPLAQQLQNDPQPTTYPLPLPLVCRMAKCLCSPRQPRRRPCHRPGLQCHRLRPLPPPQQAAALLATWPMPQTALTAAACQSGLPWRLRFSPPAACWLPRLRWDACCTGGAGLSDGVRQPSRPHHPPSPAQLLPRPLTPTRPQRRVANGRAKQRQHSTQQSRWLQPPLESLAPASCLSELKLSAPI